MKLTDVFAAVDALLREAEVTAPPAPLELLASFRRVREIKRVTMPQAGRLVPLGPDFEIHVNASDSPARQRFSAAHEIGHTFFSAGMTISDPFVGSFSHPEDSEEYLCDAAAARILFHPSWLEPLVDAADPGLDGLLSIRDECDASIEATAYAIARSAGWPAWSLIVWEPGLRKEERRSLGQLALDTFVVNGPEQKMRVARTYATSTSPFMPRNKSADAGSSIDLAWRDERRVDAKELLNIGRQTWLVSSESTFAPYPLGSGQVMPRVISSIRWLNISNEGTRSRR